MILCCGILTQHSHIILGALGCGAFNNPIDIVASCFYEVLNEPIFVNKFKYIGFAIYGNKTFIPFKRVFDCKKRL